MQYEILSERDYPEFLRLYTDSFPEEERRPYADTADLANFILSNGDRFHILAAREADRFVGFITYWQFPDYIYGEHFAIIPEMRGRNIGAHMMRHLLDNVSHNMILEVELPETEIARRRIGFYERLGFTPHPEIPYIQPPYSPGLQELPLMLMTHGDVDLSDWRKAVAPILRNVYNYHP